MINVRTYLKLIFVVYTRNEGIVLSKYSMTLFFNIKYLKVKVLYEFIKRIHPTDIVWKT